MADATITLENLKAKVNAFRDARNWRQHHHLKNTILALTGEVGELAHIFRYLSDEQVKEILANTSKKEEVADELADIFWLLLYLSDDMKIDLSSALEKKLEKTGKKYPLR